MRTPDGEDAAEQRERLGAALRRIGGEVEQEPDGALRIHGVPLPRISDLAWEEKVRLYELSPHQATLEEAYMQLTHDAVEYRSNASGGVGDQYDAELLGAAELDGVAV